jgi:surface carbohydrate biosynthesis protein (TIGR04326 family)
MEVIMEPISRLICHCDAVFTSNATSAAVDSYYLDGNVIVTLNPNSLNQSPLRGVQGVSFVSSSDGLVNALLCCENANQEDFEKIEFFYINQSLSNWHKQLLGDS